MEQTWKEKLPTYYREWVVIKLAGGGDLQGSVEAVFDDYFRLHELDTDEHHDVSFAGIVSIRKSNNPHPRHAILYQPDK